MNNLSQPYIQKNSFFMKYIILFSMYIIFLTNIYSQEYFKITCDITIKEKFSDNQFSLTKGYLEYNKFLDKTVLNLTFPEHETLIMTKDSIKRIYKNKIFYQVNASPLHEYSVFNLFLNGNLQNYGLKKSLYKITNVEQKTNGSIYTTWQSTKKTKFKFGKVIVVRENNKLTGVAFYNIKEKLISRQIFKDYIELKSLSFPTKIISITNKDEKEEYKITEFKNIVLE